MLGSIFRITLDPNEEVDAAGHKLTYLAELRHELESDGAEVRISQANLDAAIMEAATLVPHDRSIFNYLLPCWKRTIKAQKNLRGYTSRKEEVLKEAKRLCMSSCIFASEMPEIYQSVYLLTARITY